jgi:F5/8 type C domain
MIDLANVTKNQKQVSQIGPMLYTIWSRCFKLGLVGVGAVVTACNPVSVITSPPVNNQAWFAASKYGLMMHYLPRDITEPIPADPNGMWNTTVKNFDVKRFVSDVQKTGAAYVVFSVGQNSGFFASPNAFYEKKVGLTPGQYTSERDLIADLSVALKAVNVRLMVYAAVIGPTQAPVEIRARFPSGDDQAGAETRASLNAMFEEWSKRWGASVAGWWLDGCYPGVAGYGNSTDGEQNVDALLKAVRAGNSDALATCNPSVQRFEALSKEQDYMAGEENVFHRYPKAEALQFKGRNQIWHVMSYLGTAWGNGTAVNYPAEQLASYIQHVSDRNGVVTVDLGIHADGSLFAPQLETMSRVKALIRDQQPFSKNPNLALYKTVRMISNTSGLELPFNGAVFAHFASYATDGLRDSRNAQAAFEYPWSLVIDLDVSTGFSRAEVTFPRDTFATDFDLEVSDDQQVWKTVKHMDISAGGTYSLQFPEAKARYVRLKANHPDGPDQPGAQMAISELELYAN